MNEIEKELAELLLRSKTTEENIKPKLKEIFSDMTTTFVFFSANVDFDAFINKIISLSKRTALLKQDSAELIEKFGEEFGKVISQAVYNLHNNAEEIANKIDKKQ